MVRGGSSSIWFKQVREFRKYFNVLLIDLRGHGNSKPALSDAFDDKYTFDYVTHDIIEVIDHLKIDQSHFVGISLGTVLIRNLAEKHPERVVSMIMGGAIIRLDVRFRMLMLFGNMFKSMVPYIWLYKLFTFAIMPDSNHKESRLLFIREAKKLYQQEFLRWYKMGSQVSGLLRSFRAKDMGIPTLFVMGGEDYLFLPSVKKMVQKQSQASLLTIEHCGHVVNVEQPALFNSFVVSYIADFGR